MKLVQINTKNTLIAADSGEGITDEQKTEFFKLYTALSPKIKKFVGRKKNGKLIRSNFESLLKAMRELKELA